MMNDNIFNEVTFLNEKSFAAKRAIKESEEYEKMMKLIKDFKKTNKKDKESKLEIAKQAIKAVDEVIAMANDIPADNILEWIARTFIRQFDNGFRLLMNLFGWNLIKVTRYVTKSDFLDKLHDMREDLRIYIANNDK